MEITNENGNISPLPKHFSREWLHVLPRYEPVKIISRGASGEIALALDKSNDHRKVAIKRFISFYEDP